LRPYAHVDLGAGMTGTQLRPLLRTGIGVDIGLSRAISIGPLLGYGHMFQIDVPGASTDARFVWFGLSVFYRPVWSSGPAVEVRERVRDRYTVIEREGPPAQPIPPSEELMALIEESVPLDTKRIELLAQVLFEFDSDTLAPLGVAMLHEVRRTLDERTEIALLESEGYADSRGNPEYNLELSQRRAERVRIWLIDHGIAAERLRVAPRGELRPVEKEETDAAFEQNRRVVFRVLEQAEPRQAAQVEQSAPPEQPANGAQEAAP
jgi:outer membrane protein OmpA-like peptidoglycan-associated protein